MSPGTEVTDDSEQLPCVFWEVNLSPLERQPALLPADSSLQFHTAVFFFFLKIMCCIFVLCVLGIHVCCYAVIAVILCWN